MKNDIFTAHYDMLDRFPQARKERSMPEINYDELVATIYAVYKPHQPDGFMSCVKNSDKGIPCSVCKAVDEIANAITANPHIIDTRNE